MVLVNIGYIIMNTAILQNAFASKLLDINQDQQLIDTGLYSRVRHPLYTGAIIWLLTMPIALGSWWALIPAVVNTITIQFRLRCLLVRWMEWDAHVVGNNAAFLAYFGEESAWWHVNVLLAMTAGFLIAAAFILRWREFTTSAEADV